MSAITLEDLKKAIHKEKDVDMVERILGINMVCLRNCDIKFAADALTHANRI